MRAMLLASAMLGLMAVNDLEPRMVRSNVGQGKNKKRSKKERTKRREARKAKRVNRRK